MAEFKPMLAKDAPSDLSKLNFPLVVQAKLDGIRCSIVGGRALTRTLKEIPNREVFETLSRLELDGLDGEIIVGPVTAKDAYRRTCSFVMAPKKTGEPWCFYVFDKWNHPGGFTERIGAAVAVVANAPSEVLLIGARQVRDGAALLHQERAAIDAGHEGVILRDPSALYKFGRSGKLGPLLKLKRFVDFEAEIVGCYEEQHNGNEPTRNALGRTERSSVKANKVGKGRLGGFELRAINGPWAGAEFRCGTGFNAEQREMFWNDWLRLPHMLCGRTVKVKAFDIGSKDLPRHPVFLHFRDMESGA